MTAIEKAIKDAIEKGGWIPKGVEMQKITHWFLHDGVLKLLGTYKKIKSVTDYILIEQIFLDPSFWQALGKAWGWEKDDHHYYSHSCNTAWEFKWHCFIDHLAEGKDAESFFQL